MITIDSAVNTQSVGNSYVTPLRNESAIVESYSASREPTKGVEFKNLTFTLTNSVFYFSGGAARLKLLNKIRFSYHRSNFQLVVEGWNLVVNGGEASRMPEHLIRHFVKYHTKAGGGELSELESEAWARMVADVDVQDFDAQISPYRYVEGTLISKNDSSAKIRLHDDRVFVLNAPLFQRFDVVNQDESFGAQVKFGIGEEITSIESVLPLFENV